MKLATLVIFLFIVIAAKAQDSIKITSVDSAKGIVSTGDSTYSKVEIESEYPGGPASWSRYLGKTMHYPNDAINNEIQGTILVKFIVDKDGSLSDIHAVSGPEKGGLREESIRVVRQSGKWTPAIHNGRQVKSYKTQPIVFKLSVQ